MNRPLPVLALLLGLAGLLPFVACGVLALRPDDGRGAMALAAYAAVILAFLGGVHWGFALGEPLGVPSGRGERARLGLGVVPSLVGWVGLLMVVALDASAGLALLALGFIGTTLVERRGLAAGLVPPGYMKLRYALSGTVVAILGFVLVMRVLGIHVNVL